MKVSDAVSGFVLTGKVFPIDIGDVPALLFSKRARRAVSGLVVLRRAYEHVVVMAALEGARPVPGPYYEAYVDALNILGARATWVASAL